MKLVNEMQIDIGLQSMFKIIPLDSVIELSSMVEEERKCFLALHPTIFAAFSHISYLSTVHTKLTQRWGTI
ncbi:Uncharacterized protein APZ42_018149 [Daphnia magna]|uniref:Uncharacterized protein n=1 Tax=Daphnia magna TaxID=35525 RepID=A0A164ZB76_9CRUS|nr:Uncharacterized protein APZ42_018149 [Daphnia magna]